MADQCSDSDSYDSTSEDESQQQHGRLSLGTARGFKVQEEDLVSVNERPVRGMPPGQTPPSAGPAAAPARAGKHQQQQQPAVVVFRRTESESGAITIDTAATGVASNKKQAKSEWFLDAYDIVDSREAVMHGKDPVEPKRSASFTDSLRSALRTSRLFGSENSSSPRGESAGSNRTNGNEQMKAVDQRQPSLATQSPRPAADGSRLKVTTKEARRNDSRDSSFEHIAPLPAEAAGQKRPSKILPQIPAGVGTVVDGDPSLRRPQSYPARGTPPPPKAANRTDGSEGKESYRYSSGSQYSVDDQDHIFKSVISLDSFKKRRSQISNKEFSPSTDKLILQTDCFPPYFADFPADRRSLIALELYTTERSYVRGLEIVVELFKRSITASGLLDAKEVDTIFSNIEEILCANLLVLNTLAERLQAWSDDQMISDIFIDNESSFQQYSTYCKTYDSGEALLKQKQKKKKEFENLLLSCYENSACQPGLTLPSYLIMVVQRIPRYILLLKDLQRKTPAGHKDSMGLATSVTAMEKLANYINDQLKQSQSQKALEALQFQIAGLKAYYMSGRVLTHEGAVSMMNIKKTYQCVLFNDLLVLAVKGSAKSEVELVLDLKVVWFEDVEDLDPQTTRQDAIAIYTPDRPYTLYVGSSAEKKLWLTHMKSAIIKNVYGADAKVKECDIEKRSASHTYKHGSVYSGTYLMAKRHGVGMMMWPNQMTYKGEWYDDERNGVGSLSFNNGEVYEGEWLDNLEHGKAVMKYPNGDQVIGSWRHGCRHGKADIKFANGDTFEGSFANDKIEGQGKLVCTNGVFYDGEWKRNMRHGHGTSRNLTGDVHIGEFRYDKPHGQGSVTYADGSTYTGDFENGEPHGIGLSSVAKETYQGSWSHGFMEGRGRKVFNNGDVYDGTWVRSKRYGHGTLTCTNGNTYDGQWEKDHKCGSGMMTWHDGSSYDGKWLMGNRHGFGKHCSPNTYVYEGFWIDDLYHGKGVLTTASGSVYSGQWMQGKLDGPASLLIKASNYAYEGEWKNGMKDGRGKEVRGNITFEGDFKQDKRDGRGTETVSDQMTYEGTWKRGLKHGKGVLRLFNGVAQHQLWSFGSLVEAAASVARELPSIRRH